LEWTAVKGELLHHNQRSSRHPVSPIVKFKNASAGDGLEGSFERTISELKGVKPAVSPELAHECGDLGSEP
jgi:hypothetical protein